MPPPVFVSYRRADEPFAAALIFALLADRWDGDPVFLDTRFLRQRGDFGPQLLDAVANSELVLAVVGRAWDETDYRTRLADPNDWVRRELIAAAQTGKPVVPVLVDREDVPTELPFEPVPEWSDPIHLDSSDFWHTAEMVVAQAATILAAPNRDAATPPELIYPAVDAMLRHVLPAPQRRMRNDEMVARVVADELGEQDWLRFVATANLPQRPNGSAVVWVTSKDLEVADLGTDLRPRTPVSRIRRADLRSVARIDGRRLWKTVSDLQFALDAGPVLHLCGFFAEEADELLDVLSMIDWSGC
jgi:hypothetical protein